MMCAKAITKLDNKTSRWKKKNHPFHTTVVHDAQLEACWLCFLRLCLPTQASSVWLLTFFSLHGWSDYWSDLGTKCTNTEIRKERGRWADSAALSTPLLLLQTPPSPPRKRGEKKKVLGVSAPTEQTPRHGKWTLTAHRIKSQIQSQQCKQS